MKELRPYPWAVPVAVAVAITVGFVVLTLVLGASALPASTPQSTTGRTFGLPVVPPGSGAIVSSPLYPSPPATSGASRSGGALVPAALTGRFVPGALADRLPIAVFVDDNRVARPQSGFNAASIVYQAPADGFETRYLLVFQEGDTSEVGPVRSGRPYFIRWAAESRSGIAHYGGDLQSRLFLRAYDGELFTDIDALRTTIRPFHRISTRETPHNAYTSTVALRGVLPLLGGPATMPAGLARRLFVDEAPIEQRAESQTIVVPYTTVTVEYLYDRATDMYDRILDGTPQVDAADGQPVRTSNVVVLFMSVRLDPKIEPGYRRPVIGDIGTGRALIFREGHATQATWSKADESSLTILLDDRGFQIPLVRGTTFFQIVPIGTEITVNP